MSALFSAIITPIEQPNHLLKPTDIKVVVGEENEHGFEILACAVDGETLSTPECGLVDWVVTVMVERGFVLEAGKEFYIQKAAIFPNTQEIKNEQP
jgi:hypothetical protein